MQLTQSFVSLDTLKLSRLLDRPLSDVGPLLRSILILQFLFGMADLPPGFPVLGKLFVEGRGDG